MTAVDSKSMDRKMIYLSDGSERMFHPIGAGHISVIQNDCDPQESLVDLPGTRRLHLPTNLIFEVLH